MLSQVLYRGLENESGKETVQDSETCAEWGGTEEHVLRWSLTGADAYIAVHKRATWLTAGMEYGESPEYHSVQNFGSRCPDKGRAIGRWTYGCFHFREEQISKNKSLRVRPRSPLGAGRDKYVHSHKKNDHEQRTTRLGQDITYGTSFSTQF